MTGIFVMATIDGGQWLFLGLLGRQPGIPDDDREKTSIEEG